MVNPLEASGDIEVAGEEMAGMNAEGLGKRRDSAGVAKSPIAEKAECAKDRAGWKFEATQRLV